MAFSAYRQKKYQYIFLLYYFLTIFFQVARTSQLNAIFESPNKFVVLGIIGIMSLAFLWFQELNTFEIGYAVFSAVLCALSLLGSHRVIEPLLLLTVLVFGMKIDHDDLCRTYIVAASLSLALVLVLYAMGILEYDAYIRGDGSVRLYLGFSYTTTAPNLFYHIVIAYFFMSTSKVTVLNSSVILVINCVLYRLTDTRAAFAEVIMMLMVLWLQRLLSHTTLSLKFPIKWASRLAMPGFCALAFALSLGYRSDRMLLVKLDAKLNNRLSQASKAIAKYGFSLFGKSIKWSTGRLGIDRTTEYLFVDFSFINIALCYGFVMLVFVVLGMTFLACKKFAEKNYNACIALCFLALHCFTDPQLLDIRYTPMLAMMFAGYYYIYQKHAPAKFV